ncbi:MAG: TetR/AcrR family transcriptional regulator [Anaerolineae bacterium]
MAIQRRGEATRSHILDAALECFARNGYDATSVAEICHHAGVTKGAFYHHFSSKQSLFLEMLERWLQGIDTQLEAARFEGRAVPEELFHMTAMVGRVFQDARGRLPIFLEFLTKAGQSPIIWQATAAPLRKYQRFFAARFQQGIAEGSFREVDAEMAANVLLSFAVGLLALGLLDPHGADWGQVAQEGMGILLDGLTREHGVGVTAISEQG